MHIHNAPFWQNFRALAAPTEKPLSRSQLVEIASAGGERSSSSSSPAWPVHLGSPMLPSRSVPPPRSADLPK